MAAGSVIYVHGMGGSAAEAEHYSPLFPGYDVTGFDYKSQTPWEAKEEFRAFFGSALDPCKPTVLIANSIGAYFLMGAKIARNVKRAVFISPVVDMENIIISMMKRANVTENELKERGEIVTESGETLSFKYLSYVREYPISWSVPTKIIYGENDLLVPHSLVTEFAEHINASLYVLKGGEHWFHTKEQMDFIAATIKERL
ncbi:MAG: alpha/beta hydrolase [Clostridia bacterium]|nr:alpha/beta hydrolase [Clostridia bacterium]